MPRPGYGTTYRFLLAGGEPVLPMLVCEHLKHRFLMDYFASERIHEAHIVVHVRADERMAIIVTRQEFVDDHSLVNEIDGKRAASKLPILIFENVGRTNDGGNTMLGKILLQKN